MDKDQIIKIKGNGVKKKTLALATCMAFSTPSICFAKGLADNSLGLNLGDIQANSYLNEPFKGVIPFLFTSVESSSQLTIRLAPDSIFKQVGAEKFPILKDLNFQVTTQDNKPVILISSKRPIQQPFLNFILEVVGPQGSVYQDYTVLLDPPTQQLGQSKSSKTQDELLLAIYSSTNLTSSHPSKYKVKGGDSLSTIAKKFQANGISLNKMMSSIHLKNPQAFIRNDINKIRKGAILSLPFAEVNSADLTASKNKEITPKPDVQTTTEKTQVATEGSYKVKKGDNLSKITKKYVYTNVSFTKMMNAIYTANPHAFSKNRINLLKAGANLRIPSVDEVAPQNIGRVQGKIEQQPHLKESENSTTTADSSDSNNVEVEQVNKVNNGDYIVKEGDSLGKITRVIGYKDVSYTKMMKAIYIANPQAFKKNNITTLKVGATIHLPPLSVINTDVKVASSVLGDSKDNIVKTYNKINGSVNSEKRGIDNLKKRVRELRSDLSRAKIGLSDLQQTLTDRNSLIYRNDAELIKLKSKVIKLKQATAEAGDGLLPEELDPDYKIAEQSSINQAVTENQVKTNSVDNGYFSAKKLTYTSMALILGLLLMRYRKEIYSYASISYEHPNFFPTLKTSKLKPSERNKCDQDTLVDPDINLEKDNDDESIFTQSAFDTKDKSDHSALDQDNHSETPAPKEENSKEIEHCEHLITELFDELDIDRQTKDIRADWDSIEKVCDNYIEKINLEENINLIEAGTEGPEESVDFETMMSDLFKSLDEEEAFISEDISANIDQVSKNYDLDKSADNETVV